MPAALFHQFPEFSKNALCAHAVPAASRLVIKINGSCNYTKNKWPLSILNECHKIAVHDPCFLTEPPAPKVTINSKTTMK